VVKEVEYLWEGAVAWVDKVQLLVNLKEEET